MPIFSEAYKRYQQRGLVVLAASLDDAATKKFVAKFAHAYKMDFPVLLDATSDMMKQMGLGDSVPSTLFLDENGNVSGKISGQARKKDVFTRIEQLLDHSGHAEAAKPNSP